MVAIAPDLRGELGLPEPFRIRDFDGPLIEWLQRCRWQFEAIVDGHLAIDGRTVAACGDHETLFWHLVTGDRGPKRGRWLDLERCAMLGRVWDILERQAKGDLRACSWRQPRRNRAGRSGRARLDTVVVAPVDLSFMVVLRECRETLLLVTTYPLGRQEAARRMEKAAVQS